MKFIDPDGKDIILNYTDDKGKKQTYDYKNGSTYKGNNQFIKNFYSAVTILNKAGAGKMIESLEKNSSKVFIQQGTKSQYDTKEKTLTWNPSQALVTTKNVALSPMSVLNHEVDHALDHAAKGNAHLTDNKPDAQYGNTEERRVITGSEQDTALKLGEIKPGEVTRTDHRTGTLMSTPDPTSQLEMDTAPGKKTTNDIRKEY